MSRALWAKTNSDGASSTPIVDGSGGNPPVKAVIVKAGTINTYSKREAAGEHPAAVDSNSSSGNTQINYVPATQNIFPSSDNNNTNNNNNNNNESSQPATTDKAAQARAFYANQRPSLNMSPTRDEPSETDPLSPDSRDDPSPDDDLLESDLLNPSTPTQVPSTPTSGEPLRRQWTTRSSTVESDDDAKVDPCSDQRTWTPADQRSRTQPSLGKKIIR